MSANPRDCIEPNARFAGQDVIGDGDWAHPNETVSEYEAQTSIAISLKRLADLADAWARGSFNYNPENPA